MILSKQTYGNSPRASRTFGYVSPSIVMVHPDLHQATIPNIDNVLSRMFESDYSVRISAAEAHDRLAQIVLGIPPIALLIPPVILESQS